MGAQTNPEHAMPVQRRQRDKSSPRGAGASSTAGQLAGVSTTVTIDGASTANLRGSLVAVQTTQRWEEGSAQGKPGTS